MQVAKKSGTSRGKHFFVVNLRLNSGFLWILLKVNGVKYAGLGAAQINPDLLSQDKVVFALL